MTAATHPATPSRDTIGGEESSRRFSRTLRSERLALRSTPTAWVLLVASAFMALASVSATLAAVDTAELATDGTIRLVMHSSTVATLVFAMVAGVVASTGDFRFGRIDQMLLSEPTRRLVVASKVLVGAGLGALYGLVGAAVAAVSVVTTFAVRGAELDTTSSIFLGPIAGVIPAAALFALIGVAVGLIVRNQPATLAGSLAFLLIVEPTLLIGLPRAGRWFPGAAGLALTNSPDPNLLDPLAAGLVLAAYGMAVSLFAAHRFGRSDV